MNSLIAPAKLNLYLHITGRRDDGYHLIDSLFVFTEFGDEIQLREADEISLTIKGPFQSCFNNEAIETNLVYRAALLLKEKYNIKRGISITLIKNIPVGAGLGGGSTDAATILKALNILWEINAELTELAKLGLSLGADIPACIYSQPSIVSGIGEIVDPVPWGLNGIPVLLVNPNQALLTPAVYKKYKALSTDFTPIQTGTETNQLDNIEKFQHYLSTKSNDLEYPAKQLLNKIEKILDFLHAQDHCLLARMSGSGPTCFALFADQNSAQRTLEKINRIHPDWWTMTSWIKNTEDTTLKLKGMAKQAIQNKIVE